MGDEIYDLYNHFVGTYLYHLYREEHERQQALWDNFTDEELGAIDGAIMADASPELMAQFLTLICRSFNPGELAFMLCVMKDAMPPEAFQGILQEAESATPAEIRAKVRERI